MSTPLDHIKSELNLVTRDVSVADSMIHACLAKKFEKYAAITRYSPVRHASAITNLATSDTSSPMDKFTMALSTYAYVGQLPLLMGRTAARFAPGIGQALLFKDIYGVAANIIDAGARNNVPLCQNLQRHRIAMEDGVAESCMQALNFSKGKNSGNSGGGGNTSI